MNDTCDRTARRFLDILQSFNLTQNKSCSTHIAGHMFDLVITRCDQNFASCFEVSASYRNLKSVSKDNFCADLQNSELLKSADALDLNELLSCYNRTLAALLNTYAPLKCREVSCRPRMPWFTAEIG